MPLLVKSLQNNHLNDTEKEDFLPSDKDDDDYNFKFVPANFFNHVVKNVRRQRCKEDEELIWTAFVNQQELNNLNYSAQKCMSSTEKIEGISHQSMNKINRQAEILEKEVPSDKSKRICNSSAKIANFQNLSQATGLKNTLPIKKTVIQDNGRNNIIVPRQHRKANSSNQDKSLDNKNYKVHAKDSSPDNLMSKMKTVYSRHLPYSMEKCEYNSNPELSINNDNRKDGTILMRVDQAIAQKIIAKQKKISYLLDEILFRLHKIPLPDGEKDVKRRQQRVMEFAIRFSRNYLYELHRDIATMQRHIHAIVLCTRMRANQRSIAFHVHAIEQKLISAHQLLLHALIAYCKHIPSSIIKDEPSKLKELLQVVIDLKDICNKIHLEANYFGSGDDGRTLEIDIDNKCSNILSKLSLSSDKESQVICHNTHTLCSSAPMLPHRSKYSAHKNLCNRLHMYNTDTKTTKIYYKKRLTTCPSKDSKYGIISGKNLLVHCPSTPDRTNPSPVTQISPKEITRNQIVQQFTSLREDDINTMMDSFPINIDDNTRTALQNRQSTVVLSKKYNTLSKFHSKTKDSQCSKTNNKIVNDKRPVIANRDEDFTKKLNLSAEKHLSNFVPVIADLMSLAVNKKSEVNENLDAKVSPNTDYAKYHALQNPSGERVSESVPTKTNSLENVKLVYMSSMENTLDTPRNHDVSCQADYESLSSIFRYGKVKKEVEHNSPLKKLVKIVIPEAVKIRFLTWRHEHQRFSLENPMYSTSTQNKPWDIVTWISDKLVDELIIEIAKELELDDLIQKLFKLEFEEY